MSVKDVAARAGVSLGTVSNVLNRPELVRPATRMRVESSMEELGFVRNESARQLRAGSSNLLPYVMFDVGNPFFADVARGMEDVAAAAGLTLVLCTSNQHPAREDEHLRLLEQHRVHGLLVTPVDVTNPLLRSLPERGTPVVYVDRSVDASIACSVAVDDRAGGYLAVTHLLELGHERIAFVGGPASLPQVADRLAGALEALRSAGVDSDALVVIDTDALSVGEGRAAGGRILGQPARSRPTAAFCANDLLALGLLQHCVSMGRTVPGDLAIVGYDDIEFAAAAAVPLTSVWQPRGQLGRRAIELLLDEAKPNHTHEQVVFTPELVVRQSTASGSHG